MSTGPGVKCFDLLSFYFGCHLIAVAGGTSLATPCTISVSGFRGNTMVGEQAFNFGHPVSPPMTPNLPWNGS